MWELYKIGYFEVIAISCEPPSWFQSNTLPLVGSNGIIWRIQIMRQHQGLLWTQRDPQRLCLLGKSGARAKLLEVAVGAQLVYYFESFVLIFLEGISSWLCLHTSWIRAIDDCIWHEQLFLHIHSVGTKGVGVFGYYICYTPQPHASTVTEQHYLSLEKNRCLTRTV